MIDPVKVLKAKLNQQKIFPLEFVQMISRIVSSNSKELYAKAWYPDAEANMNYFIIPNRSNLIKYVLHAKHRATVSHLDRMRDQIGEEELQNLVDQSNKFIV